MTGFRSDRWHEVLNGIWSTSRTGEVINSIRNADDKAVISSSQKLQQILMDKLNTVTQIYMYGVKIKVKKFKVMCMNHKRTNKIKI